MAQPLLSPVTVGAICYQCGTPMAATVEVNNRGNAITRLLYHCDTCKYSCSASFAHVMSQPTKYMSPEDRKAASAAAKERGKSQQRSIPAAAVPTLVGLRRAANAGER